MCHVVRGHARTTAPATGQNAATHILVDSVKAAKKVFKDITKSVEQSKVIAVDIEGDLSATGRLSLIQIGLESEAVFLFDVLKCPNLLNEKSGLRALLSGPTTKVLHDCRNDAVALKGQFNIVLTEVWDTQTSHAILMGKEPRSYLQSLNVILKAYAGESNKNKAQVKHGPGVWEERPIPSLLQSYAAQDVQHLVKAYRNMYEAVVARKLLQPVSAAITARLARALNASVSKRQKPEQILKETATAFWEHVKSSFSVRDLEDRDAFANAYNEWKAREASAGRKWKGGVAAVLFTLSRMKKIKKVKRSTVPTVVFHNSGGISAAIARVIASRHEIAQDKNGVHVSALEFAQVVSIGATSHQLINIRNTAPLDRWLESVEMMHERSFALSLEGASLPILLRSNASVVLKISFKPTRVGVEQDTLSLIFKGVAGGKFTIGRFFEARCGDADLIDDLGPCAPFEKAKRAASKAMKGTFVKAPAPDKRGGPVYFDPPLGKHAIPQDWLQICQLGEAENELERAHLLLTLAPGGAQAAASPREYIQLYQRLLWSEELQVQGDLALFNLIGDKATTLEAAGRHLRLAVAGLAEKRPSLLPGDVLRARLRGDPSIYIGRIEFVEREDVLLRFDKVLHSRYLPGQRIEVEFVLNRAPWRLFHQGLAHVTKDFLQHVLFPAVDATSGGDTHVEDEEVPSCSASPFNRSVGANPEQWHAVSSILQASHRPYPFLVFGPPGTGKTTTLVEAILQRVKQEPSIKVLVCAPTNTAADVLCSRLTQLNTSVMLRLTARTRRPCDVEPQVLPYTYSEEGEFAIPPLATIQEKRVVVATLSMAAKLINVGVSPGHFDLVVVDEAGQAMEPEIVAAVAPLRIPQVVLGGDPRQLGPVIHSPAAKKFGLSMSLLERLIACPMYSRGASGVHPGAGNGECFNRKYMTMLVRNYRSHSLLLQIPNNLFYNGALKARADPAIVNCRLHWDGLPTKGVPLFWHGVVGKEEREASSPSWFNGDEAVCILKHVMSLLRMRPDCKQHDIGIITPYNKQVHKITRLLRANDMRDIKVGSAEMFQGQERQVILVSTVRSSHDVTGFDAKHNIGFLDNPKRFNVAVTRACCLLIIVGNPNLFVRDPHWGKLLELCRDTGAYAGVDLQPRLEELDELQLAAAQAKLEELLLEEDPDGEAVDGEHLQAATLEMRQGAMPMPEFDL